MARVMFGIIAAVASFILVESLTCNQCNYGLLGFCLSNSEVTCSTNTSVCFTGKASFPSVSSSVGFNTQGCREPTGCNATTNGTLLGITYETKIDCCSTDKCNPVQLSSAPSNKVALTTVITGAILVSMWSTL
ncbi:uncharacterized protein V6R79_019669 [Siganus canaliculatus]